MKKKLVPNNYGCFRVYYPLFFLWLVIHFFPANLLSEETSTSEEGHVIELSGGEGLYLRKYPGMDRKEMRQKACKIASKLNSCLNKKKIQQLLNKYFKDMPEGSKEGIDPKRKPPVFGVLVSNQGKVRLGFCGLVQPNGGTVDGNSSLLCNALPSESRCPNPLGNCAEQSILARMLRKGSYQLKEFDGKVYLVSNTGSSNEQFYIVALNTKGVGASMVVKPPCPNCSTMGFNMGNVELYDPLRILTESEVTADKIKFNRTIGMGMLGILGSYTVDGVTYYLVKRTMGENDVFLNNLSAYFVSSSINGAAVVVSGGSFLGTAAGSTAGLPIAFVRAALDEYDHIQEQKLQAFSRIECADSAFSKITGIEPRQETLSDKIYYTWLDFKSFIGLR